MHLRYDPINNTVMSGRTSLHDVAIRDLDLIRREMRARCHDWNGARRYMIRLPDSFKMARPWNAHRLPSLAAMRAAEVELVRPPRQMARFASVRDEREKAMRMMQAYCAADAKAALKLFGLPGQLIADTIDMPKPAPKMPPLDAPKPAPRARVKSVKSGEEFIDRLMRRGYRVLGAGAYSSVLCKGNSNRVIKVSRRPDSWLDYVVWAAKKGHMGKNAPMVYSFHRFNEGSGDEFYVAVVERMKRTISELPYGEQRASKLFGHLTTAMYGRVGSEHDALAADDMQPGCLRFAIEFKLHFRHDLDLHAGNFMIREDGSVVCTDPICGNPSGTAPRRWRASSARLAA